MKTLGIAVLCKNEEVMIDRMLDSVIGADEIVICDTGSTDSSVSNHDNYERQKRHMAKQLGDI